MNVSLTDDLSAFVADQLKEGGYNNQSEVVREGLRLLRARNEKLVQLRHAVAVGMADIDAGRTIPLTSEVLRDIADRAKQRVRSRKSRPA